MQVNPTDDIMDTNGKPVLTIALILNSRDLSDLSNIKYCPIAVH